MDFDEYAERQRGIVERTLGFVLRRLRPFLGLRVRPAEWGAILEDIFPEVSEARYESASLAREYYDDVRERNDLPPNDIVLASYDLSWFKESMEPARTKFSKPDATETDLTEVASRVAKEVENGGRKTMIRGVQNEPTEEPAADVQQVEDPDQDMPEGKVRRWARVPTGRETCAFCYMLVSRGPVYLSARDAGLEVTDTEAAQLYHKGDQESLNALMTRWHPNCDCKVVPVYDFDNWEGRDTYLKWKQIWADQGSGREDPLNAFRRYLENNRPGEVPDSSDESEEQPAIAA